MSIVLEDKDRRVIPRWREFHRTLSLSELSPIQPPSDPSESIPSDFAARIKDWEQEHSFSFAADLVSCAIVLRREADARDAAKFIVAQGSSPFETARELARGILGIARISTASEQPPEDLPVVILHNQAHGLRATLHDEPRNAFLWADLARCYAALGVRSKAARSMDIALRLVPENRFVLRSASRLYVHQDDYRLAHDILKSCQRVRYDPWLLAAEIAVASTARRNSRYVKTARRMLEAGRFGWFHLSELASALATLELEAGNTRRARRLLECSLIEASENAIAQAAWVARRSGTIRVYQPLTKKVRSSEAQAWDHCQKAEWSQAVYHSRCWLFDQPFSSRPAILGSYIAAVCQEDYQQAADIADQGLVANPTNFTLLNNHAFALCGLGQLEKAQKVFERIDSSGLSPESEVVRLATSGLLRYRTGDLQAGRRLYQQAIEQSTTHGYIRQRALAQLLFTLEELRSGTPEAEAYKRTTLESVEGLEHPDLQPVINRLRTTHSASQ